MKSQASAAFGDAMASDKVERGDACLSKKRANTSNLSKYSIFLRFALFFNINFH